jgi:hypothetical protein
MDAKRLQQLAGIRVTEQIDDELFISEGLLTKAVDWLQGKQSLKKAFYTDGPRAVTLLSEVKKELAEVQDFLKKMYTEDTIFKGDEKYLEELDFLAKNCKEMFFSKGTGDKDKSVFGEFSTLVTKLTK